MIWEALSAIGTIGAVVVALFGPAIQRRYVRKKSNALFALAYRSSIVTAKVRLESLAKSWPLDHRGDDAWSVHSTLTRSGETQSNFLKICARLDELTGREVDLTKWGSADLDLAAKISVAIESTAHFQVGAATLAHDTDGRNWTAMMDSVHAAQQEAMRALRLASDAIIDALNSYAATANRD